MRIIQEDSSFEQDPNFLKNKRKLETTVKKIENGTVKFYTFEELDEILEKTISKYEG